MFTAKFWRDAIERAVKTAAQTAATLFVGDVTVLNIDWTAGGALVGTATLLSVLTSIASATIGDPSTAAALYKPGRHSVDRE